MKPEDATRLCIEALRGEEVRTGAQDIWEPSIRSVADALESGDQVIVEARDHFVESLDGGDTRADRTWREECESLLPRLAALEKALAAADALNEYLARWEDDGNQTYSGLAAEYRKQRAELDALGGVGQ